MKERFRGNAGRIPVLVLLVFSFCILAPVQALAKKTETVRLEISDAGVLEIKSASKCPSKSGHKPRPNFPERGCVRAPEGEALEVVFSLSGKTSNAACEQPYRYELNGIQLGGKNDLKPSTAEWENPTTSLDEDVQDDFDVDAESGWVEYTTNTNGDIILADQNTSTDGYYLWYRVRASCNNPDAPNPIYYDPRIDNEGGTQ